MNDNQNYSLFQDLFMKTEELFGFIEEQKKLEIEVIGLMKGIDGCPQNRDESHDLRCAIESLSCELKKSVESQKSIQCNLNEVIKTLGTCQKGTQSIGDIPCLEEDFHDENRMIPLINNAHGTQSSNRSSPNKDITEMINVPELEKCNSGSSSKSGRSKICITKSRGKCPCYSTLRDDFKAMSKPNIFIYVVEEFCRKHNEELEEWSEPFYTSHVGYRMSAKIGFSQDFIGIYVKLVEGEYDNLLAWPFRSEIAFTLLNQVDEEKSITKILKPHPCDSDEYGYWIRPKFTGSCLGGWGLSNFIDMCCIKGCNDDYISEYLRNNIIYIKIKIVE